MNTQLRTQIIDFLIPLSDMQSEKSRRETLRYAGLDAIVESLDLSGGPRETITAIVCELEQHGTTDSRLPALVTLLQAITKHLGPDKHTIVEQFCAQIQEEWTQKTFAQTPSAATESTIKSTRHTSASANAFDPCEKYDALLREEPPEKLTLLVKGWLGTLGCGLLLVMIWQVASPHWWQKVLLVFFGLLPCAMPAVLAWQSLNKKRAELHFSYWECHLDKLVTPSQDVTTAVLLDATNQLSRKFEAEHALKIYGERHNPRVKLHEDTIPGENNSTTTRYRLESRQREQQ